MRNYSKIVGALAAASALVAGNAMAEIEGEVHVGYSNMYEFRFVNQGTDLVDTGIDLAYKTGNWTFNAGAWYGSFDAPNSLGGGVLRNNYDELDLYTGARYSWDRFSLEGGYIYYYYPDGGGKTQEVYLGGSADLWWGFGLDSTYYYDFDWGSGWYWDNKLTYSWEINACVNLDLALGAAWSNGLRGQRSSNPWTIANPGATNNGTQGWYVSARLPWTVRENLTITPYIKYTDGASGLKTGPNLLDNSGAFLIGGFQVAVSF